jgi:hypothetical protein
MASHSYPGIQDTIQTEKKRCGKTDQPTVAPRLESKLPRPRKAEPQPPEPQPTEPQPTERGTSMVAPLAYPASMGALRPWHVVVLGLCCLFVAVIAGLVVLVVQLTKRRQQPPPGADR